MTSTDRIRVSTFVAVSPADAFTIFTAEIDRWWFAQKMGGGAAS